MDLKYVEGQTFEEFYYENQSTFDDVLISQGQLLFDRINDSTDLDQDYIMQSVHEIVKSLNEANEQGLVLHAKEHGRNWADLNLDLILKLEWFQTVRKVYWDFLYNYYDHIDISKKEFFELEQKVNQNMDSYIKHFSSNFTYYKDRLLQSQRELIDSLSVPVIPLSNSLAVLPIVGTVDTLRAKHIQENVLKQIYELKIEKIIIDLSAVAYMDTAVVGHLFKIVNGIGIQGCKATITGIRPEITNTMVEIGIALDEKVDTKGTLQQAIEEYNQSLIRTGQKVPT